jgi:hypothetical protein
VFDAQNMASIKIDFTSDSSSILQYEKNFIPATARQRHLLPSISSSR